MECDVESCKIQTAIQTDHKAVELTIVKNKEARGKGYWKMNSSILEDERFRITFTNFWEVWSNRKDEFPNLLTWWDISKQKIREIAISHSAETSKLTT